MHGIAVIGGDKNNGWRFFQTGQVPGKLNTVHLRHANVGQHQIDMPFGTVGNRLDGQLAIGRFGDNFVRHLHRCIGQQITQSCARRKLVINDHDRQGSGAVHAALR